jgi:hypothetical protein
MIQAQLNEEPTPARQVRKELPVWLDAVLMRSLAKRPVDRYQTAEEFRRALDSLDELGALGPLADDVTVATPAPAPSPTPAPWVTPAGAYSPSSPHATTLVLNRSHLAVAGGFGAMLLLVIGLLAWVALRRPATPVQTATVPVQTPAPPAPVPSAAVPAPPVVPAPVPPVLSATEKSGSQSAAVAAPLPPKRTAAPAEFRSIVVRDVNALVVLPQGNRFAEAIVAFSEKSITASDAHSGVTLKTFPYGAVLHTTVSRGRKPRGAGGAEVQLTGGIPEGNIFARGARLWLTVETRDDRLVMRLDPPQLQPILDLMGKRTRPPIERFLDPDKP